MQALILAGGAGTRLRSVLTGLNKPMAPVAGRPFLEYLLLQLKKHEIDEVTLCVGYKADLIQSYFGMEERWDMQISYSYEMDFRGTAGALKLAEDLIHDEDFFVMNGDSLFDIELCMLMHYHRNRKATATLALAHVDDTQRYGVVGLNELGRIVSFIEKREGNREGLINSGVYVFSLKVLDFIPEGQPVSLERDILPKLIGRDVYGLPLKGYFVDGRLALSAQALTVNTSSLTAIGNDYAYDQIFSRQIEAFGQAGDVAIGISISGNSRNVIEALRAAKRKDMVAVGMTGESSGQLQAEVDYCICVPSRDTPRIQEAHILVGHVLSELVEQALFGGANG